MKRKTRLDEFESKDILVLGWPDWYLESIDKLKGRCLWCGKNLEDRRRAYCKPKDKWELSCKDYCRCAVQDLQVTPIRRYIHKLYNFECQNKKCGKHFSYFTPAKAELPVHRGEVHHKIALQDGGEDSIKNMTLVCGSCHKLKRSKNERQNNY